MDTTIEIGLPPKIVQRLDERAKTAGTTPTEYVRHLIEEDLNSSLSLRMLFAPVREEIRDSGVKDEELEHMIEEAREDLQKLN